MYRLVIKLIYLGLLSLLATNSHATTYRDEYKLSFVGNNAFFVGQAAEKWAAYIESRTRKRIKIRPYPNLMLVNGNQTRELGAIQNGTIDLAIGFSNNWSGELVELNLFSLPFLISDDKSMDAVLQNPDIKNIFNQAFDKSNIIPLGWSETGLRQLSNAIRPVVQPTDINGLKIRVVGVPLSVDTFKALNAEVIEMRWADLPSALRNKTIDGQENPFNIFLNAKLHLLGQSHVTLLNYINPALIFVVNKDVWNEWTAEDQEKVREAAEQIARENTLAVRKKEQELLNNIYSYGINVTVLNAEQLAAFKQATKAVYDKWKAKIGVELVEKAEQAIASGR